MSLLQPCSSGVCPSAAPAPAINKQYLNLMSLCRSGSLRSQALSFSVTSAFLTYLSLILDSWSTSSSQSFPLMLFWEVYRKHQEFPVRIVEGTGGLSYLRQAVKGIYCLEPDRKILQIPQAPSSEAARGSRTDGANPKDLHKPQIYAKTGANAVPLMCGFPREPPRLLRAG